MAAEKPSSRVQAWFYTTGLPSDILVDVDGMIFHLHKFPLMSRSRKLNLLITEQETSTTRKEDDKEEIEQEPCQISLPEFPGGSETFETAAKFCYGVKLELTSFNVAPLRCAGEFLEMTEEYSEGNLISRTERFLIHRVLIHVKEAIKTLKSCDALMPLAETLGIPQRCIDSIATRASSTDASLFGWPVNDVTGDASTPNRQILWNGIQSGMRRKNGNKTSTGDSWYEDLGLLSLSLYKRVIYAMRDRDLSSEIIETSLISYAKRGIPGLSRSYRKPSTTTAISSEAEQRELLETIITNLPLEKRTSATRRQSSTRTRFLFGLLRTANILNASEACRADLERKIATHLEKATLDDLLIPSYSYLSETLYDVDSIERVLGYFLEGLEGRLEAECEGGGTSRATSPETNSVMLVGKLIDGYLAEIASDANLKPDKFCDMAVALPDDARHFDDGLYRAVDVYLKAHPWLSEEEREKISGVMDCQKLTLEACTHAAQNERLPLRTVVQVLFWEQLQLRHAIAGSLLAVDTLPSDQARHSLQAQKRPETKGAAGGENQIMRVDVDSMRRRVKELERECSTLKKSIERMDKAGVRGDRGRGGRGSLWQTKRLGCKFKTQVCDSHQRTVDAPSPSRGRHHHQSMQV